MFLPSEYSSYKYIYQYSDNYVVLTNVRSVSADWQNPRTINTVVQYFNPSICTFTSTATVTSDRTFEQIETSDDFFARADCPSIVTAQFYLLFYTIFLINAMSRLFKKGGIFFGS